ncbi:BON domain-containing protein [Verrucomicrobium sp. GAS474]|uniref:BON domain-containing protein n=1 Tax=Verrucomicrobium sp. GAS474 TaxID=1882831 RepID=UPI00087D5BD8|nr:BON domain-containing protein [Verrucomicrobium sp. GAS474]SDU17827.1 BON domain-containing protein [Verrucomicrobium sp. GAS474]
MKTSLKIVALAGAAATLSLGNMSLVAQTQSSPSSKSASSDTSSSAATAATEGAQTSKDNVATTTAKQTQDRNESTVPVIQSTASDDLKVTQDIKQALKNDPNLSLKAKHARVVTTANGEVYLWGKVKSQEEEQRVIAIASPLVGNRVLKSKLQQPLGDKPTQNK